MPMKDFALLGLGDRTNASGVKQFLEHGLGFKEVALVHQPAHPLIPGDEPDRMVTMHLDTYFNVAGSGVAVGSETLLKRAAVEIYYREGKGVFKKQRERATNLHDYIRSKGFSIIDLTPSSSCLTPRTFFASRMAQFLRSRSIGRRRMYLKA